MTAKRQPRKSRIDFSVFFVTLICLAPIAATLVWTFFPSIRSATAVAKFQSAGQTYRLQDEESVLAVKRQIQRHFLDYSVYIPTEDIVVLLDVEAKNTRLESLMTKACGKGTFFVWVPFKIALPFYGEKVIEWCWKPKLQAQS